MLNAQKILKCTLGFLCFFLLSVSYTQAQYYPGYGRGGGFGGGLNRYGSEFDNVKPKGPLDPDELAKEETKWMVKKLKLTDEQEILVSSLNEDYAYQRKDLYDRIKKDFGLERPTPQQISDAKAKMTDLDEKQNKELEKILTPEQYKIYIEKKEATRKKAKQ
ncbi:hypothetical protein [Emticicia agri]|uniref:Periplasmic heavy metal sensor n=1 Tax=Emticicia agri TaxID=2492393 RepID=A0A4Q5M2G4_9BACT|nr:hypothetical protein [Emticicia agri]RYU96471.1 hypothetical protein EWM59_06550 [Emticicia agri]